MNNKYIFKKEKVVIVYLIHCNRSTAQVQKGADSSSHIQILPQSTLRIYVKAENFQKKMYNKLW